VTVQAVAPDLNGETARPNQWRQSTWLLVLGTVAYFLLGLLGRATITDGEVLSLVWPAAGAAMLLFGLTALSRWWLVSVLIAVSTVVLNLLTGASWTQVWIFVVSNVAQAICAVLLLRATVPHLRGAGGDQPLERLRDFWPIVAASAVGSLLGSVIGAVGRGLLLSDWSWVDFAVWWGRNTVGCIVIGTTGILLLASLDRWRTPEGRAEVRAAVSSRAPEAVVVTALTAALYLGAFEWFTTRPVAFPLLLPTVWVGLRFRPLPVAVHSLVVCAVVVVFTLSGEGPFAVLGSWPRQVMVAQLFIALAFCLGTLLALGRLERLALTRTLSDARAAAEAQARLMSTIVDSMHDGVTVLDENGQVLKRNPAGAEMVRSPIDTLLDVMDSKFAMTTGGQPMSPKDFPWVRAFAGENVVDQDMVLVFEDGSPNRTLAVSARELPTPDGEGPRQAVLIYHDVTKDRAQRSALESFAAVVAHDLLGPLGVVDGWTEMLAADLEEQEHLAREDAAPKLARIRVSVDTMRQFIDDLLESSTSRDQELRSTVVDLEGAARSVAEQRSAVTNDEPPRIDISAMPKVYADGAMVRQVLDNLIGNAIKYVRPRERAHVTVTARENGDRVEVTVADEGIGIPGDQRDRIFEAFHRAHPAEGYAGHGIGLSVCKRIVERHGGRIYARPPLGERGSRIVFTLPAVPSAGS
jgi:signal transduction histidine kinase